MKKALIARCAVDQTTYYYDKPYDYLLTGEFAAALPGARVLVPFGRGNKKRQAIIMSVEQVSDFEHLKPISALLDEQPLISGKMLELALWIKERTFCTYFDAFRLMLPSGINVRIVASYSTAPDFTEDMLDSLGGDERIVAEFLLHSEATVERSRLLEVMGHSGDSTLPDDMVKKGILVRTDDAVRRVGDATVRMVRLCGDAQDKRITTKQQAVYDLLQTAGAASVKEICYFTGCTQAVLNTMSKNGIIEFFENTVYRQVESHYSASAADEITLTDEQQAAYETLADSLKGGKADAALLFGVTGSGKTQVFLRLVDDAVAAGRGSIVMVPEIALTPQTLALFRSRYGNQVALFHSAMSLGQRMDEWKRVKNGDALVAVGTRSAVFAPFDNLGLIIMDEEQEHTYKSESSPRFHTRDVARFRSAQSGALLVLASATPSIETYSAALAGRYKLCKLEHRYGSAVLPQVERVDMNAELAAGNTSPLSRVLIDHLDRNLQDGNQSILLLNRRGHNTFVSCGGCGHVVSCPNCSISLTYHSANKRLMCHYCGYSEPFTEKCPECGDEHIKYSGVGTQRVEDELGYLFPNARVLRMDADTMMSRSSYETKLSAFAEGKYDIMLGTQMVAKGLDFPRVTLVGVLGADSSLYSDDYRCYENTFSLLTQVVGRSGRGEQPGVAVVQTISPDNAIISLAAQQNYESFYEGEIALRKAMIYPPYCDLCLIGFTGESREMTEQAARQFFEMLLQNQSSTDIKMIVLGPSAASIPKVGGKYRHRMIIKTKNNAAFRGLVADTLRQFGRKVSKHVSVYVDINPDSII